MIETFLLGFGAATVLCCGTAHVAWRAGLTRGARDAAADSARRLTTMGTQREAAERRALAAQAENARWKGTSLAGAGLSRSPVFLGRPSARDAEELARLVRGLSLVDDVVLADSSGFSLTRESDGASADLAALAPSLHAFIRRVALSAVPVVEVAIETATAVHVVARPLAGRGEGALLLIKTTSQRVNPLVVDAAAHAATRDLEELPQGLLPPSLTGSTDLDQLEGAPFAEVFATLERELGQHVTALSLTHDGRALFDAAKDGPDAKTRSVAASALAALADRVTRTLRATAIARIDVAIRGGYVLSWSPVAQRSRLALISFGRADARSPARVDRLLGSLRRAIPLNPAALAFTGSAA